MNFDVVIAAGSLDLYKSGHSSLVNGIAIGRIMPMQLSWRSD